MAESSEPEESPDTDNKLPLKERFVWLWHPHFWLTLVVVGIVIWLLTVLAR